MKSFLRKKWFWGIVLGLYVYTLYSQSQIIEIQSQTIDLQNQTLKTSKEAYDELFYRYEFLKRGREPVPNPFELDNALRDI